MRTMSKITAKNDRVICKKLNEEKKLESGLYLPSTAREFQNHYEVVSVGDEVQGLNPKDRVIATQNGNELVIENQVYVIFRGHQIDLAIQ